jgi:hypothetical protein
MQMIVVAEKRMIEVSKTRQILPYHQYLAPHRAQEVKVQTTIDDIAPEEIHENPRAPEEDDGAQHQSTVEDREDHAVSRDVLPFSPGGVKEQGARGE